MKKIFCSVLVINSLMVSANSWADFVLASQNTPATLMPPGQSNSSIKPILPPVDETNLGIVTFTPPAPWKITKTVQKPGMRTTTYTRSESPHTRAALSEIKLDKETNRDVNAIVTDMSSHLKELAITEKCTVEDVKPVPQTNNKFQVWIQTFECQPSASGITQLYVNVDPKHLYLFTFNDPTYPFTPEARTMDAKMLKDAIQVCYKGQPCYSLN